MSTTTLPPITILVKQEFHPVLLIVSAAVRYWEDATVNGVEDSDGSLIPLRTGDAWQPTIDLSTGRVIGWPQGTTAEIHYKVCDAGEYWLEDTAGKRMKWNGDYVPDDILAAGTGYGDYIIMKITADGLVEGWKIPHLDGEEWDQEGAK